MRETIWESPVIWMVWRRKEEVWKGIRTEVRIIRVSENNDGLIGGPLIVATVGLLGLGSFRMDGKGFELLKRTA